MKYHVYVMYSFNWVFNTYMHMECTLSDVEWHVQDVACVCMHIRTSDFEDLLLVSLTNLKLTGLSIQ